MKFFPFVAPVGLILCGLLNAFLYWWQRHSLWEDELIALTHTLQPLPQFFVGVVRNDMHPFVYFLLLKVWGVPAPGSDGWMLASSLFLGLACVGFIAFIGLRLGGRSVGLWAAGLFAILPNFAWAAGNLRMYTFVPLLALALWFGQRTYLRTGSHPALLIGVLSALALVWTHAIQFFFVFFIVAAVALECRGDLFSRQRRAWWAVQVLTLLAALPMVGNALVRGTEPLPASDLGLLLLAPAQLFSGWALTDDPAALAAGGLIFVVLLALGLRTPTGRFLALVACCAPVFTAIAVGVLGKPMFKPPVFVANAVPFLVLAAALGIAHLQGRGVRWGVGVFAVALAAASVPWSARLLPDENFGPAGRYLAQHMQPGDVVAVPRTSVFWGVMRYAAGPRWGAPLQSLPPSNPQWVGIERRISPVWQERLGLAPRQNVLLVDGKTYVHGRDAVLPPDFEGSVWVVHRKRYPDQVNMDQPVAERQVVWFGDELSVTRAVRDPAGRRQVANPPGP